MEPMDTSTINTQKKCAVYGCETRGGRMFQFPDPKINRERFEKWVSVSGNKMIINTRKENMWMKNMCIKHFEPKYVFNKRLSKSAVPTLNLPKSISEKQETLADRRSIDEKEIFGEKASLNKEVCTNKEILLNDQREEHCMKSLQTDADDEAQKTKIEKEIFPILHFIGVASRTDLLPREEKLYSIIISMRKSMHELRRSRDLLNERLALAEAELLKKQDAKC